MITVSELSVYINNFSEDLAETKEDIIIPAAEAEVEKYLGYTVASATRTYRFTGWGVDWASLPIPNASAVASVKIGDTTLAASAYTLDTAENIVRLDDDTFTRDKECVITYTAGWDETPAEIKLACLRIAALMFQETQGNIGVTGKQFADLSKQFINYTNYNKYLAPLSHLRRGDL